MIVETGKDVIEKANENEYVRSVTTTSKDVALKVGTTVTSASS